jgi:hypothetical protein
MNHLWRRTNLPRRPLTDLLILITVITKLPPWVNQEADKEEGCAKTHPVICKSRAAGDQSKSTQVNTRVYHNVLWWASNPIVVLSLAHHAWMWVMITALVIAWAMHPRSNSVRLLVYDDMRTYPEHWCCITDPLRHRQPCQGGVNILSRLYRMNYDIYVYKYIF